MIDMMKRDMMMIDDRHDDSDGNDHLCRSIAIVYIYTNTHHHHHRSNSQ